ncbi:LIC12162 family protein [Cyclobacteriaceae bacterium]|nr:LIC12162 family protein [Cyclobacteriaceae bacterium]
MKNFIISINTKAWMKGAKKIFIGDPYVYEKLFSGKKAHAYESIEVGEDLWNSSDKISEANSYVEQKLDRYLIELGLKLNEIHGIKYDKAFWNKCLLFSILRYVTMLRQTFEMCEMHFDSEKHSCKILGESSYLIPDNFEHQRDIFQYTSLGQEQLFSIYINLFYPDKYSEYHDALIFKENPKNKRSLFKKILKEDNYKLLGKVKKIMILLYNFIFFKKSKVKIGIMGSFFSFDNLNKLLLMGKGVITVLKPPHINLSKLELSLDKRSFLSENKSNGDRFDSYFYYSLKYCFPKEYLEDFKDHILNLGQYFNHFPNLQYAVSESWTGDSNEALALAILGQKKVKHINNEHNFLNHHFDRNYNELIYKNVDVFLTLGWENTTIPNVNKSGSLFEWVYPKKCAKDLDILYITGLAMVRVASFSGYQDSGFRRAKSHCKFKDSFFLNLTLPILTKIVYKPYPLENWTMSNVEPFMVSYEFKESTHDKLRKKFCKTPKKGVTSKKLMAKSKLVIIDYLSTAYIEALYENVPLIILWNKDNYPLQEEHKNFYSPLIEGGIMYTDPIAAAQLVNSVGFCPEVWWAQDRVQLGRKFFMDINLAESSDGLKYFIDLVSRGQNEF